MAAKKQSVIARFAAVVIVAFATTSITSGDSFLYSGMPNCMQLTSIPRLSLTSREDASSNSQDVKFNDARVASIGISIVTFLALGIPQMRMLKSKQRNVSVCAFENEVGVQPPLGFWDPAGLASNGDVDSFNRRRTAEIKHGRVCMIASLGYMTCEFYRWPGFASPTQKLAFADVPNGLAALSKLPMAGWFQIVGFCGTMEKSFCNQEPTRAPGDCDNCGILGIPGHSSTLQGDEKKRRLNAELANGRLAMFAIIGMFYQDGLTGSAWGDWSNYVESPLRAQQTDGECSHKFATNSFQLQAFENELGVQAPLGYWDPLGYSKDGDPLGYRRRRVTELKHGRVCMIASIGYMAPEYYRWPGFCSTTETVAQGNGKLAFLDIPNGLGALSKIPFGGWHQIVVFCSIMELNVLADNITRPPGDYENCGILGLPIPGGSLEGPEKVRRLNGELANGRLAMFAIMGMMFQDGLTGSAWGDWSLYEASPLRAFENELGVQAPLGYWDPMGLALDGNVADYARRRVTELKHGRVCMLACIGYMLPEYLRWPGSCTKGGLLFAQIPNGLGALIKMPLSGWAHIVLFCGALEKGFYIQDDSRPPGDYARAGPLGILNAQSMPLGEQRTRKLNAELANGRLAMFAILGMVAQDGLTGQAWGDWALYTLSPFR